MSVHISNAVRRQLERGIAILKEGGVVAFPTDTVYGLGACANLPAAVARVYDAKQRPRDRALPLLLAYTRQINTVASEVPGVAGILAERFWPGALTLVLHRSGSVMDVVTGGGVTVAVRVPAHPVPLALVTGVGVPLVGTSANMSGQPSPLTAEEVRAQIGDRVDLIIDGGRCPGGQESTIVDVTGEMPLVVREGAISIGELRRVCGSILVGERS